MTVQAPKWRAMTWVVLVFNVLMVLWMVGGLASVADQDCAAEHPVVEINPSAPSAERLATAERNLRNLSAREGCEAGTAIGAGIGMAFIVFVWVAGDVILGVIWLVTRKAAAPGRACPVCGTAVPVGHVVCAGCGYDYRSGAQGPVPEKPSIWPPSEASYGKRRER